MTMTRQSCVDVCVKAGQQSTTPDSVGIHGSLNTVCLAHQMHTRCISGAHTCKFCECSTPCHTVDCKQKKWPQCIPECIFSHIYHCVTKWSPCNDISSIKRATMLQNAFCNFHVAVCCNCLVYCIVFLLSAIQAAMPHHHIIPVSKHVMSM